MTSRLQPFLLVLLLGAASLIWTAPETQAQGHVTHEVQEGETLFSIAQRYGTTVSELRQMNNLRSENIREGQTLVVRRWAHTQGSTAHGDAWDDDIDDYDTRPAPVGVRPDDLVAPEPIPTGPPPPPPPPADIERIEIGHGAAQPLPTANPAAGEAAESGVHMVQAGETLFAISRRYGITVEALMRANELRETHLAVGQELRVPGAAAPVNVHLVRPGRYDVTRSTLPDDEIHVVLPGETLFSIAARYGTTAGRLLALNRVTTGPLTAGTIVVLPDGVGRTYYREPAPPRVDEEGLALIYPSSYVGRMTISDEPYDPAALTASHRHLPFGTILRVIEPESGRQTLVRVNDRGPISEGFLIELSEAAAHALGLEPGTAHPVQVHVLR